MDRGANIEAIDEVSLNDDNDNTYKMASAVLLSDIVYLSIYLSICLSVFVSLRMDALLVIGPHNKDMSRLLVFLNII